MSLDLITCYSEINPLTPRVKPWVSDTKSSNF